MRQKRQSLILKLITNNDIKTQEQLTDALREHGFATTQATVSRDIKELGLIKISSSDGGYKYAVKPAAGAVRQKHIDVFSDTVVMITSALHTVVIKTYPGMAQAVCASCDMMIGNKILGSIAGEDTILIITHSEQEALSLCDELRRIFKN